MFFGKMFFLWIGTTACFLSIFLLSSVRFISLINPAWIFCYGWDISLPQEPYHHCFIYLTSVNCFFLVRYMIRSSSCGGGKEYFCHPLYALSTGHVQYMPFETLLLPETLNVGRKKIKQTMEHHRFLNRYPTAALNAILL